MARAPVVIALTPRVSALNLFVETAYAGNTKAKVNCNSPGAIGKISNLLMRLDPTDENVVHVSGRCHENLPIHGFERLSLVTDQANKRASPQFMAPRLLLC